MHAHVCRVGHFENIKRHTAGIISTHMPKFVHVAEIVLALERSRAFWAMVPLPRPLRGFDKKNTLRQILYDAVFHTENLVPIY